MITRGEVVSRIAAYLQHKISIAEIVDWEENAMQEGEFDEAEGDSRPK